MQFFAKRIRAFRGYRFFYTNTERYLAYGTQSVGKRTGVTLRVRFAGAKPHILKRKYNFIFDKIYLFQYILKYFSLSFFLLFFFTPYLKVLLYSCRCIVNKGLVYSRKRPKYKILILFLTK